MPSERLYLKPAHSKRLGRNHIVRQPERNGAPLPAEGASVPRNAYYLRRLAEGSVVEAKPPRPATKKRASNEE
jgi:hypothetical protein